jgi:hypothetical protein
MSVRSGVHLFRAKNRTGSRVVLPPHAGAEHAVAQLGPYPVIFLEKFEPYLEKWNPANVREIAQFVVAYKPERFLPPSSDIEDLLTQDPSLAKFAGIPLRLEFEARFHEFEIAITDHELTDWQDLLRLNLRHATEADHHCTNGQALVTSVPMADGTCSLAAHTNLEDFLSLSPSRPSLIPEQVVIARDENQKTQLACQWLESVERLSVPVRRMNAAGAPDTMMWREWGFERFSDGSRRTGIILSFEDRIK